MKAVVTMLSLLALSLLTGCLNFGDDIELKGAEIDGSVLKTIEAQTGLQLPEGIGGQYYFYLGSGVDDALWFKASVSEAQKTELLKDTLFTHEDEQPCQQMQMNFDRDWWKVDRLQAPAHYSAKINGGTGLVACSIGDESGKITLYLVWFST